MKTADPKKLTPVEYRGQFFFKRDDLFEVFGVCGGKVRTCLRLAQGAQSIVCAASRKSPQLCYAAAVAKGLGIGCTLYTASGPSTKEMDYAREHGAEIMQIRPGYSSVVAARAKGHAERTGSRLIPFGMECPEAVEGTARQAKSIPQEVRRIVCVAGSGMTLAGILAGLGAWRGPILGVMVGADPTRRLDEYAPGWRGRGVQLVESGLPYEREVLNNVLSGIVLDPMYEAKCIPFLQPEDLFWIVGVRPTAAKPTRKWKG